MKTHERIKVEKEDERLTSITCNKCGKHQVLDETNNQGFVEENQYQSIYLHFNYGSKFDMDVWEFDLCEECIVQIVRGFKYLPEGYEKEYVDKEFPVKD